MTEGKVDKIDDIMLDRLEKALLAATASGEELNLQNVLNQIHKNYILYELNNNITKYLAMLGEGKNEDN